MQRTVCQQTGDATCDVKVELAHVERHANIQISTAFGRKRVNEDDCLASIEFLEHGLEVWIARPSIAIVVGINADAVALQRVKCVFNFLYASLYVRKRHCGKYAETFWIFLHQLRGVLVSGSYCG